MSKESELKLEEENIKLAKSIYSMEYEVKRSEALTSILQMLESEKSFEEVAASILKVIGEFLGVSNVSLSKRDVNGEKVVSILEWIPDEGVPILSLVADDVRTKYIDEKIKSKSLTISLNLSIVATVTF